MKKNKKIEYADAPKDIEESLSRGRVVPNFELTPEGVREFAEKYKKKPVNIYLTVATINKFKEAAERTGSKYQTMISDVLDTYTERHL